MNPLDPNSSFNGPLTPVQFKQNREGAQPSEPKPNPGSFKSPGKYLPLVIGGLALLILPVTLWQLNTQQDIRQRASVSNPVKERAIAKVGEEYITDADLDFEYTKQQNATVYMTAPSVLKGELLETVIEKKLISMEANKRNIAVSDEELENKIKELRKEGSGLALNEKIVKENILADKVAIAVSPSVFAYIVYSSDKNMKSEFEEIKKETEETDSLTQSVGSYLESGKISLIENVQIGQRNTLLSNTLASILVKSDTGEISDVFEDEGLLVIAQTLGTNPGEYASFEEFLSERKEKFVKLLIDS